MACKDADEKKIRASVWFFSVERGEIFRELNNGDEEFITLDDPKIENWIAMHKKDFVEFIDICTGVKIKNVDKSKFSNR